MVKVFHCADIHLDSPFSLFSPREAERRRIELRSAFTSALMYAREYKIDIFIISGDLFDSEYVTRDTRELLVKEFSKLKNMHIFITAGNHDPFTSGSIYETADFSENVHVFSRERWMVPLDELGVDVYGFSFDDKEYLSSPVSGWDIKNKERINILVCHGDTTGASSVTGPITKKEIAQSGFDYIALGHIHKPSGLLREGNTYYSYPGCIEGRSFDELGYKGAMVGVMEKGNVNMQFKPFSKRRYEIAEVDISSAKNKIEAVDIIRSEIRCFTEDTALRLILTGELDELLLIRNVDIGKGYEYPYYIEIIDKTRLRPNKSQLEQSNTLKGVFYRKATEEANSVQTDSEDANILALALKYGMAALDDREVADYNGGDGR